MGTNPYVGNPLPKAADFLKGAVGNDSNNEENNPYVGGSPESVGEDMPPAYNPQGAAPAPSMGPRFTALAEGAGMGSFARAAAPAAAALAPAAGSALSGISPAIPAAASAVAGAAEKPSFQRFQNYVNQYRSQKLTDFSKLGPPENIDDLAARVHMRETSGNPNAVNVHTKAAGLFQYLPSTWAGHGGFESAEKAPQETQYHRFITDMAGAIKRNNGNVPIGILSHYEGEGAAKKILKDPSKLYQVPGQYNGSESGYSRIRSILGAPTADAWVSDHNTKLANAQSTLENIYNVNPAGAEQG